jgi:hypothetical protein
VQRSGPAVVHQRAVHWPADTMTLKDFARVLQPGT